MRFTTRLIVFGYPLVEFVLLWLIASVIGWGWALTGIVLGVPVGIAIMRNASAGARVALQETEPERALERVGATAGLFLAGLCFLVPGYGSDVVGLVLLFPPIRRWVMRRMTRGFDSFAWVDRMPGFPSSGTVIQGTVISTEDPGVSDFPRISDVPDSVDSRDSPGDLGRMGTAGDAQDTEDTEDTEDTDDEPQPPGATFPS